MILADSTETPIRLVGETAVVEEKAAAEEEKSAKRRPNSARLSRRKAILFRAVAVMLPLLVFALIEVAFRLFSHDGSASDPYINVSPFLMFSTERVDGEDYYRITHRRGYAERNVAIPVKKPANGLRIICLGGSACASWPHPPQETFAKYLEQALSVAYPNREVEVINAAAHGFASYRVRRVFDQILPLEPDFIIVYSGNNEFLEDRGYELANVPVIDALGRNLRSVRWLRAKLFDARMDLPGEDLKDVAMFFYRKAQRESLELRKDPAKFARVKDHYAASMEHMVGEAESRGIPLLLFTVPVNLADWLPTVSNSSLEGERYREWERLYYLGRRGLLEGNPADGIRFMRQAIAMDPEHAESHYWLARLLEAAGEAGPALASYKRARDLDYNPFRAHGDFNATLRRLADEYHHAVLVDLEEEFERASERHVPGFDLFLDYVHPNKQGNLLIAKAAFDAVVRHGPAPATEDTPQFRRSSVSLEANGAPYDEQNVELQLTLFSLYAINHQHQAAIDQAEHVARLATGQPADQDAADLLLQPWAPAILREGHRALGRHQAVLRCDILGIPVDPLERDAAQRQFKGFYEKWFAYGNY